MKSFISVLLAVSAAATVVSAFVDDERQAVVIEADAGSGRSGRQLWSYPVMSTTSGTGFPVVPASTQMLPISPLARALCRTRSGQLAWCNYQIPGIMGWPGMGQQGQMGGYPPQLGFPGQYPGQQPGGFPGQQPVYPGQQFPGQQPGGFPGQQPGGFPGQQPGGFPGQQPGGFPGQQPGGFPGQQPGGFPAQPVAPVQPVPTQPPPRPVQPAPTQAPAQAPDQAVIVDNQTPVQPAPAPVGCGKGKYAIRYAQNGSVAEEIYRNSGSRVTDGLPSDQGEWPWIAALMNNGRQFCGGSLIDSKHILTAAHCVAHMSRYDVANLKVRLGEWKIKQRGETELFETKAARVVRHKEFTQQTLHKDVAIITMEEEVPASMAGHIRPVCMASGSDTYAGRTATVTGWGSIKENGPQPDTLLEMTVKIWDNAKCKNTYGNAAPGGIMDHMLCAGEQGRDSCSGDSGGPMQAGTGDHWTQIGIVSWGIGCGKSHYPGVYTRVTSVRSWIDRILGEY